MDEKEKKDYMMVGGIVGLVIAFLAFLAFLANMGNRKNKTITTTAKYDSEGRPIEIKERYDYE